MSGASIEDQIAITEMALEKFNPTTIYLAADPWLFNVYNNQKRWKSLKLEYYKTLSNIDSWNREKKEKVFSKEKIINESDKMTHITFGESILEKIYNDININSKRYLSLNIDNSEHKGLILRDGKRVYGKTYQDQKIKEEIIRYASMDNFEFSDLQFNNYDNFLDYLKNYHKKEIILVLSPYYSNSFELTIKRIPVYLEIEKKFIDLAAKNKIKILGSYNPKLVNCEDNEFYDSMHPKDICMKKLLRKIN